MSKHKPHAVWHVFRWLLALGLGGATYQWTAHSAISALVAGWYAWESAPIYAAVLRRGPHRRLAAWALALPRAVGTAIALALTAAWRPSLAREHAIALAYLLLLALEGVYRLALRRFRPGLYDRAESARLEPGAPGEKHVLSWRGVPSLPLPYAQGFGSGQALALACASILVIALPLTLSLYGLRQVALDVRTYVAGLERWGAYDVIAPLAGDAAIRAAAGMLRPSPTQPKVAEATTVAQRALRQPGQEDKAVAVPALLPPLWTEAVIGEALDATFSWIQSRDARQRVPAVSLPAHDVKRHLQEAISVLLDRHIAALPVCAPGASPAASCRPADVSAAAYTATYKPEAMAAVEEAFALIPAELDLSTAVTLFPRAFEKPLAVADQVRKGVHSLDRALAWAGIGCLLAWAFLWLLSANSLRSALCWTGVALFVGAGRSWLYSWSLLAWSAERVLPVHVPQALARTGLLNKTQALPASLASLPAQALADLARSAHALLAPWTLSLAGTGLLLAVAAALWPPARSLRAGPVRGPFQGRRVPKEPALRAAKSRRAVRMLVVVLAAGSLLWRAYIDAGRGLYNRAYAAHRQGDVAQAIAGYQQLERWYPFATDPFIVSLSTRARQGMRECRRYQDAEAAYRAGDYKAATYGYEALLAANPTMALRDTAEAHLAESLYRWAESLRQAGEYERALDRYRFLSVYVPRDKQDRQVQRTIADLYTTWGEALQCDGDYRAAIATYRRIAYDVLSSPRLWAEADKRIAGAYCAWSTSLRAGQDDKQADRVCEERAEGVAPADLPPCAACASEVEIRNP